MPSIEENRFWGQYAWPQDGAEWSNEWGDVETHWYITILPRIRRFLPAKRILEIAPGFGRWSGFLIDRAEQYVGIDLNPECTAACQKRFADADHAKFGTNDGKSLDAVPNNSVDLAFSFDSLVHVEIDVISSYLRELSQKLAPNGIAFLHHSNLGEYDGLPLREAERLKRLTIKWPLVPKILDRLQITNWSHWRARSVTSKSFAASSSTNGLKCIGQEIIRWGRHNRRMIDCLSTITRPGSKWERSNVVIRNPYFMAEAASARVVSRMYASLPS